EVAALAAGAEVEQEEPAVGLVGREGLAFAVDIDDEGAVEAGEIGPRAVPAVDDEEGGLVVGCALLGPDGPEVLAVVAGAGECAGLAPGEAGEVGDAGEVVVGEA